MERENRRKSYVVLCADFFGQFSTRNGQRSLLATVSCDNDDSLAPQAPQRPQDDVSYTPRFL